MRKRYSVSRGFTIVELLIVVVVIAILAAISIVAYTGIQQRARNSARLSAAQNVRRQVEIFTQLSGEYYGSNNFCIPTEANFDSGNGGLLDCYDGTRSENATANSNFSAHNIQFSYPDLPVTRANGTVMRGANLAYFHNTSQGMNGVLQPNVIIFFLEGSNQDCGSNSVTSNGLSTTDPLNSIVPSRNHGYDAASTLCALSVTHYSNI